MDNSNYRIYTPSQKKILQETKDAMVSINDKIQKLEESMGCPMPRIAQHSHETYLVEKDLVLNKGIVLKLMKVGQTTLARWRYKGLLKYQPKSSREIVYRYQDLMDALRSGRLASRDFDQYAAIKRLTAWYESNA